MRLASEIAKTLNENGVHCGALLDEDVIAIIAAKLEPVRDALDAIQQAATVDVLCAADVIGSELLEALKGIPAVLALLSEDGLDANGNLTVTDVSVTGAVASVDLRQAFITAASAAQKAGLTVEEFAAIIDTFELPSIEDIGEYIRRTISKLSEEPLDT